LPVSCLLSAWYDVAWLRLPGLRRAIGAGEMNRANRYNRDTDGIMVQGTW